MSLSETVKNNSLKIIIGSASSIIAIVSALFTIDARYAHAADVEKDKVQTNQVIRETSQTLRKQMLEDKIFELDIKKAQNGGKSDPIETALRGRYQRQIEEINKSQAK